VTDLVVADVTVEGRRGHVHVRDGVVAAVLALDDRAPSGSGADVLDGHGAALVPGLWDHHIHLGALAAARLSLPVGPPQVTDRAGLAAALGAEEGRGWIRAVGYHESVAGPLDRAALDALAPGRPVRVQHRSGALWMLNGVAVDAVGLAAADHPGIERDGEGVPTGRVFGADRWLRDRLPGGPLPDLTEVGAVLARHGVTGVTDLTPYPDPRDLDHLAAAAAGLPQRVIATGGPELAGAPFPAGLGRGPVKLLLADHDLPLLDDVVDGMGRAHRAGRNVAVHCVTRTALVLALTAWDVVGVAPGDRVEHGAVVPPELLGRMAAAGLTVVTQPGFVAERGDQYLTDVDDEDPHGLYPCRTLLEAGIPVAGSTDAPFGDPDPWRAMRAATTRRTRGGVPLGPAEAVAPARALDLFLGPPDRPGGPRRRLFPGAPADLCLLTGPEPEVLGRRDAPPVRATVIGGRVVFGA
jgi:predicted amidohydrolase YtcJ